jgi:hypothetical protein
VTILQAQWETGVALTEGKSLGKSLATGSLKLAGPFVDRFFKSSAVTKLLQRACVPIKITVATSSGIENVASTVAGKWLGKVVQKQGVERQGKAAIKAFGGPAPAYTPNVSRPRQSALIEGATFTNDTLLTLAIVNMDKGIGRGL